MDSDSNQIILTSKICKRIKDIYHLGSDWSKSYVDVSNKLSSIRKNMNIYYPNLKEEERLEIALNLGERDFMDMVDFKKDVLRET